jgi:hypothetical protein
MISLALLCQQWTGVLCFVLVCVCVTVLVEGKGWNERACRYKSNLLAVVLSSSKNQLWISANKVTKLEERLLNPPVHSLRRTHAYYGLPFAGTESGRTSATDCYNCLLCLEFNNYTAVWLSIIIPIMCYSCWSPPVCIIVWKGTIFLILKLTTIENPLLWLVNICHK